MHIKEKKELFVQVLDILNSGLCPFFPGLGFILLFLRLRVYFLCFLTSGLCPYFSGFGFMSADINPQKF